jgi:hypothetical protein
MVEETLSSVTPKINVPSKPNNVNLGAGERQATASKNANTRAAAKPVDRQQKLKVHLLIGFVMAGMAVLGYTFLGSGANVNAAGAANHQLINVSPNGGIPVQPVAPMQVPAMSGSAMASDMAALHAEMEAITRQMNALNAGNTTIDLPPAAGGSQSTSGLNGYSGSTNYNGTLGNNPEQVQATLEQMMAITHDMMSKMENMKQNQAGGAGSSTGGHH